MYKSRRWGVFFRDLYALLRWSEECSDDCKVKMENGNYEVIVCSWLPQSGKRGDNQQINIYFIAKSELPKLRYIGVPFLGDEEMENQKIIQRIKFLILYLLRKEKLHEIR